MVNASQMLSRNLYWREDGSKAWAGNSASLNNMNSLFQLRIGMHNYNMLKYSLKLTWWSYAIPRATQDVAKYFPSYSLGLPYIDCGAMATIWP